MTSLHLGGWHLLHYALVVIPLAVLLAVIAWRGRR